MSSPSISDDVSLQVFGAYQYAYEAADGFLPPMIPVDVLLIGRMSSRFACAIQRDLAEKGVHPFTEVDPDITPKALEVRGLTFDIVENVDAWCVIQINPDIL